MTTPTTPSLFVPGNTGATSKPKISKATLLPAAEAGAVIYIDGGSRPNPGFGGLGIHGYIYNSEEPKRGTGCKKGIPTWRGYMEKASAKEKPITLLKYIDGYDVIAFGTNQAAELSAAITAINKMLEIREEFSIGRVVLLADSKYVVDGMRSWVHGWIANGWKKNDGVPPSNLELWQTLYNKTKQLEEFGVGIEWEWVKGHDGDIGNSKADYMATCGVISAKKGYTEGWMELTDAQGYWNVSTQYNRLFTHSKWYFNTNVGGALRTADGKWIYHLGNHGPEDQLLGKRISDARFSVLMVDEAVPALELVRNYQDKVSPPGAQSIVIGRLDNIFQADNHAHLNKHGDKHLDTYGSTKYSKRNDLGLPPKGNEEEEEGEAKYYTPITKELIPPRLAQNALNVLGLLEVILNQYREDPVKHELIVTDITSILYEVEVGKKITVCKLRKTINSSTKSIEVNVNYNVGPKSGTVPVTLTLDIDTPDRNALSAIADIQPKVVVVSWRESDAAFRYALIVEANKDIGIWAGVYSNFKVLPK